MAEQKLVICPYCGDAQPLADRCRACSGLFEPLSRKATHNAMGPWFVRDTERPFQPGCSYETLLRLVERGRVTRFTIIRGPTTRQFWTIAKRVPGLSHILGYCHACDASVDPGDHACHACGAAFGAIVDRNYLGLPEIQPLPWEADADPSLHQMRQQKPMWRSEGDASEPRTISSFASDEELRSTGAPLPEPFGGAGGPTDSSGGAHARGAITQVQPTTITAPQLQPHNGKHAPKSAHPSNPQRTLQQRHLIIASIITVASLSILLLGIMFFTSKPSDSKAGIDDAESLTPASDAESSALPPVLAPELWIDYERAIGLIDAASDAHRPLSDRIADYEQAMRLLTNITAQADVQQWPADLQQHMETARLELDRLRLREFFP